MISYISSFKLDFTLYYFYYCIYMYICIMSAFNERILLLLLTFYTRNSKCQEQPFSQLTYMG